MTCSGWCSLMIGGLLAGLGPVGAVGQLVPDAPPSRPTGMPEVLVPAGQGQVARLSDPLLLELVDGRLLRLADLWAGAPDDPRPVVAALRRDALDRLRRQLKGQTVAFFAAGASHDRMGRLRVHLVGPGGGWVQAQLLASGHAVVWPGRDTPAGLIAQLRAREGPARQARAGLWRDDAMVNWAAASLEAAGEGALPAGYFIVLSGMVRGDRDVGDNRWLNMGSDWRRDVTILLRGDMRRLARRRLPDTMEGRAIEVRGPLRYYGGPLIEPARWSDLWLGDAHSEKGPSADQPPSDFNPE